MKPTQLQPAAAPQAYVGQLCAFYPAGDLERLKKQLAVLRRVWKLPDQSCTLEKAVQDAYDHATARA